MKTIYCIYFFSAFDAVTTSAVPLRGNKDRVKPISGRRAPTRVSNLAHMNTESTDRFIDEQTAADSHRKPRPLSEM